MAIVNRYLGKFSAEGKPEGFLLEGVNYKTKEEKERKMAEGWVELTQDEWEYYTNNKGMGDNGTGYIRDPQTGRPVSAPPRVYTKMELANMAKGQCDSSLNQIDAEIMKIKTVNPSATDVIEELQAERKHVLDVYDENLTKIENGEITKPDQIIVA